MIQKIYEVLLKEAKRAYKKGEIPVAAVIVKNNKIIAKAYNTKEKSRTVTAHAELLVINRASKKLKNWRLDGCDIYISLEPCTMCASAIHQARIDNIYYFVKKATCGKNNILNEIIVEKNSNKKTHMYYIEFGNDLKSILQDFFKKRR